MGPGTAPLVLQPKLSAVVSHLVSRGGKIPHRLVEVHGSPCHVILPGALADRAEAFGRAFTATGVRGQIYFAAKANKSDALLETAARIGLGVDVASREEFIAALAAGTPGERIMVTGPNKGASLHRLSVIHGATVAIDSPDELGELSRVAAGLSMGASVRAMLRYRPTCAADSRFGMSAREMTAILRAPFWTEGSAKLEGFSVHLSGYDPTARAAAGAELVELCRRATAIGASPRMIDLGGGWPVSYVSKEDWLRFKAEIGPNHFHAARQFTAFYPYYGPHPGAEALSVCLEHEISDGENLASMVAHENITVAIEPGRALLDQAGLSLFRVRHARMTEGGYFIITVEGQSFSISEQWFGSEFLPDPLLITRQPRASDPVVACIAGLSCLESDMLTWRKVVFPSCPTPGDLIVYANTAGYQMDSNESEFHRLPTPRKVAVWESADGFAWCEDRLFHLVEPLGGDRPA